MDIIKIKSILDNFSEFSGVIQITENSKTLLSEVRGYAKRSDEIPNNINTSFGIASGTKGFTALAVLKLVDEGKISLSDNVFSLIPFDFPNILEKVEVQHLLSHTSGIYDYYDEEVVESFAELFETVPVNKILGPSDMLPLLTKGECYFSPSEKFKYCNSAFVVLGMLIEAVSGMKYSEYLSENIIKPLCLRNTGCYITNELPNNSSHGYIQKEDKSWISNIFEIPMACTADGGIYTTVDDIERMWNGFVEGNLISDELKEKALSPIAHIYDDRYYGLGFYMQKNKDGTIKKVYLEGGDPGVGFLSYYYIKEKRIITIISNANDTAWDLNKIITEYMD